LIDQADPNGEPVDSRTAARIVAISSTPRKGGNSDILVKHCTGCSLRAKCIRGKKAKFKSIIDSANTYNQQMIERFDTDRGRHCHSRRMGTVEPVFANIRGNLGLDRFTLRGREKVDTQWKLFCAVHNIGKIAAHWRQR
jgi:DDE family transposase